jgi:conjugative relaxase-like TrwC/TraI family protein
MLSVASVGSASGASNYFAKDNYYSQGEQSEFSSWGGKAAETLGLEGKVDPETFEKVLDGKLPDGTVVNDSVNRRAGVDLTFSMPKSASVLALIGGDKRILEANKAAVEKTMGVAEEKFAQVRDYSKSSNGEGVRSGNLLYAMFQHDTSRKLDPQSHIHVVVAAMSQDKEGKWKALFNGELWKNNSVLGSNYHAFLREELRQIGYETKLTGKHGQFEIVGVAEKVTEAFSQRRQEIVAAAAEKGRDLSETEELRKITKTTRDPKINVGDKASLMESWKQRAAELGFDGKDLIAASIERAGRNGEETRDIGSTVRSIVSEAKETIGAYFRSSDPLATNGANRFRLAPNELRTEIAVASAVRILGEREAAFSPDAIGKTALDLGLKGVTVDKVDARVAKLLQEDKLVPGKSDRIDGTVELVTTPEHLRLERALLANVDAGREKTAPIVDAANVADRLQAVAGDHELNGEQLAAGTMALSTKDRTSVVQGVAGAGKTTLISAIASVAAEEGKQVIGLSFANKMVNDLRNETVVRKPNGELVAGGIEAKTVSSFVNQHLRGAIRGQGPEFEASKEALRDKVLVLDEASLVANKPMNDLVTIANRLGVEKLVMIGDKNQLLSIEAGKAFSLIQSNDPTMARMDTSLRQRTEHMKQVAGLAREGKFAEAFKTMGDKVTSAGADHLSKVAEKWLALSPEDRERTAIYSSGRDARAAINSQVQAGLKAEGALKGDGIELRTLLPAHATREELRYSSTYKDGQLLEVMRRDVAGLPDRGRYDVLGVDAKGRVMLKDEEGKTHKLDPTKLDPNDKRDPLRLSEKQREKIYEGDKIRWTAKDDKRGLMKSEEAKVLEIKDGRIKIENAKGEIVDLQKGDKMLERLGLSYALNMHQAQGDTRDKAIGEMHSSQRNLSNERLALVMMTRVRDDIEIVTNDKDALVAQLGRNPGNKTSALEALGEKRVDGKGPGLGMKASPKFDPKIPDSLKTPDASPAKVNASLSPAAQLSLPERNIERSR